MWVSHLCGSGRYVGFVPASSIFPQFAASSTHVLVSILTVKSIHISGFTFAFIEDDSIEFNFFDSVLSTLPNSTLDTNDDAVLHPARPSPSLSQISSAPWDQRNPTYSHIINSKLGRCSEFDAVG